MHPNTQQQVYRGLEGRIFADFDNERVFDFNIVGLSQTNEVLNFEGHRVVLKEQDFVYLYMQVDEFLAQYVVAEGKVIANPYESKPYRWCCQLTTEIEYFEDYQQRWSK